MIIIYILKIAYIFNVSIIAIVVLFTLLFYFYAFIDKHKYFGRGMRTYFLSFLLSARYEVRYTKWSSWFHVCSL